MHVDMHGSVLWWLLALVHLGNTAVANVAHTTPTLRGRESAGIFTIVPTTTVPIEINPVESDLGNLKTYVGEIYRTDTQ